jgi:hypothetical protein
MLSRQKEEADQSNKRVIVNLKDKIRHLTERVNEIQSQMVDLKIGRELREREHSELWSSYETLKSQSSLLETSLPRKENSGEGLILSSSGREFLKLGEEINEIDKLQDNAFEEEIMMFASGEDNLRKVQDIINENCKLKEKVSGLESRGQREAREDKLAKRLAVMKRRN